MVDNVTRFSDFFLMKYKNELYDLFQSDEKSLIIDFFELEKYDTELADLLIAKPEEVFNIIQKSIEQINTTNKEVHINVRFKNINDNIDLSQLLSKYIGKFVCVDGIVRKTDEVRPRLDTAVFECMGCMRLHKVKQRSERGIVEPTMCKECSNKHFRLVQEDSTYMDTQTVRIQEPLEKLSGGTEPKQVLLVLEDDLVDQVNPGDKVRITGILKTTRDKRNGKFKNHIYVNHIEHLEQEFEELDITEEDEAQIIELSKDPLVYDKIIDSIAPAIEGYDNIKEAIALQLFGGSVKELEDNTRIRGDIHILVVGDPGMGKSQILKYVSKLAPRSIYTSGKGTSGAGLTAAAVRDELGGWSLEAGALVLGDKGNVCIDELDKMRAEDRSALHEALEQQTVSIAKAGIMATLNTRCSVLAAANPKFGRFDRFKTIAEQIDLPAPLFSRFDLTFIIEDKVNTGKDRKLAKHILKTHRKKSVNYEVDPELLRKYIGYAHTNFNPKISRETSKVLEDFYVNVRKWGIDEDAPVPITPRQLEAIIRLAEASARLQLKEVVDVEDALRAIRLQEECLKQVGFDPDTGKIDIDMVEGRTPKSYREKFKLVTDTIRTMQEEDDYAYADRLYNIIESEYNIGHKELDDILVKLKNKGVIYESSNGGYKLLFP